MPKSAFICSDASGLSLGCFFRSSFSHSSAFWGYASIYGDVRIREGASGHAKRVLWLPMIKTFSVLNSVATARTARSTSSNVRIGRALDIIPAADAACQNFDSLRTMIAAHRSATGDPFRGTYDSSPQGKVAEIHPIRSDEWRREPQSSHTLIAADQQIAKTANRKVEQRLPFANESSFRKAACHRSE